MGGRRHLQIVTSDGNILEDTCYHRTRNLPRADTFRLDDAERLCLTLLRHACESIASGTAHGAELAHELADREVGEADGAILIGNITALLHAIRVERRRDFSFLVADCPVCSRHLCEEEQAIVELLRAARKSDGPALTDRACDLVGEGMVVCVVLAASVLGAQLDALSSVVGCQRPFRVPG
jgi:hypothetical protein